MKKITLSTLFFCLLSGLALNAQEKKAFSKKTAQQTIQLNATNQAHKDEAGTVRCLTTENEDRLQTLYPNRYSTEEFENWLAPKVAEMKQKMAAQKTMGTNTVVTIPVVVHVIHNGDAVGSNENISDTRVASQITVLNEDYRRMAGTPGYNTNAVGADTEIEFCLAQTAPDGSLTSGIDRVNLSGYTWNNTNVEGVLKPQTQWDPTQYFNIWVCEFGGDLGGILGYAQFPSNSGLGGLNTNGGAANTDGVVLDWRCFGSSDYAAGSYFSSYDKGRTLTHEIGHCLGLRHIWGDSSSCVVNATDSAQDYCPDTPAAADANYDCNADYDSCTLAAGNDMTENYMDYTNDTCMNVFTQDQKTRMLTVLANSPRRVELLSSTVCNAPNPEDYDGKVEINSINSTACSNVITPIVELTNLGNITLTSATISYYIDANTPATYNWTGSLAYGASETITLPSATISDNNAHVYYATIASVNGTSDMVASNDSSSYPFQTDAAIDMNSTITLEVQPDLYGSEITWEITNAAGAIVYSGGPYNDGTATQNPFTGAYTFSNIDPLDTQSIPLSVGCYTFTIYDSYGDGICALADLGYPEADGYYSLQSDGVEFAGGCDYTDSESVSFSVYDALSTESFNLEQISLYPNPAGNTLNINIGNNELPTSYSIYNTLGQRVLNKGIENAQDLQINTSALATGVYVVKIESGSESVALQFIKK
ncbi:T9SS type A sorting domain-containing protein [Neptunitalea lumnitzerae]|uniref:T9SS type A sorting domain-containing protein n=1 Tax=Neptunitalea lumnitzerae TaxID=2965509 RepID=A0ABQ5MG09_9FLAO|nr:T9SS type A sorting domain-containing protein [Neptunitalea sp. Y10]GLB48353.1 hypothetical protein Y10_07210 [Neptunitalea sp. Y10]